MAKVKNAAEHDVLHLFVNEMETKGVTRQMISFDLDDTTPNQMREKLNVKASLDEIHRFADKCLANEWLEHRYLGSGQYSGLVLTATGHGVVRSRQAKEATKAKRSVLKRASDYVEDHKGLFVVVGAMIALAGVLGKFWG